MRGLPSRRWSIAALAALLTAAAVLIAVAVSGGSPSRPTAGRQHAVASPAPVRTALLPAAAPDAPVPSAAGLLKVLGSALSAPALGTLSLSIVDVATRTPLLERAATVPVIPASTAKIATAVAALVTLPPQTTFTTKVVAGAAAGDVVLVGGGDPLLAGAHPLDGFPVRARLADLAAAVRKTGVPLRRVLVDDGLFTGERLGPGWRPSYVGGGAVAPVSALEVDGGRLADGDHAARSADPALAAGRQLADLIGVRSAVTRTSARPGAAVLAQVVSPPVSEIVEAMLGRSDNDVAEALGRQVALATQLPATFEGEARAIAAAVAPLVGGQQYFSLRDASGLSPLDRAQPAGLTRLITAAAGDARFGPLLSGLPVAGFDGTLAKRYRTAPTSVAAGLVRAKTGTLDGVGALAGLVRTSNGRLLAFDLTANGVPASGATAAQAALDRVAAALASCGCR